MEAIAAIQANCQFYNYEIFQSPPAPTSPSDSELLAKIAQHTQPLQEMTNQPQQNFSGATFTGPVNFGNNPTGDFIGTQNNYTFPDPQPTEATRAVTDLLQNLRRRHPQASDTEILEIIQQGFESMRQTQPQKWQRWLDLFSLVFAGGIEAVKVAAPALGIPIEVGKQLYEIYQRNRQQLPGNKA